MIGADFDPNSAVIVNFQDDPQLLDILPPDLRKKILQQIQQDDNNKKAYILPKTKIKYDYNMVNCNQNLNELTKKLKKSKIKQYGLLLWGVSGSGKTYYARWLAQELKMPVIKKRASDLIDKWVGQTEQNIRNAFKEAKDNKAILVFDEADSFLYDRTDSNQDHQASKVNEVLVCMEDHPYPFIMTTNLKKKIDKAAIRRFLFKIKFEYMTIDNIKAGIKNYFGKGFKLTEKQLKELKYLTAGDFKTAKAKMDILDNGEYTNELIFEYLKLEQSEKEVFEGSPAINV